MPTRGRPTTRRPVLTPQDRRTLLHWSKAQGLPAGQVMRARLVLLVADGMAICLAAITVGMARRHAYTWLARYLTDGPRGLYDRRTPHGAHQGSGHHLRRFVYPIGCRVSWAEQPTRPWVVRWQRQTWHSVIPCLYEYGLQPVGEPHAELVWALAPDVLAWEGRPCRATT